MPMDILVKPAGGLCNMQCRYCFYKDELRHRADDGHSIMTEDTQKLLLARAVEASPDAVGFVYQGGEPTLAGLDFYRRQAERERAHPDTSFSHVLQTNGLLLDAGWLAFLKEHRYFVGLSLDGYSDLHDWNRPDNAGSGTFSRVLRVAKALAEYRIEFNVLTVVTKQTASHIRKVYEFFRKNGLLYQQYIPCLDPLGEERGKHPYSLTPKAYGDFLISLFDLWYADRAKGNFIYLRDFENLAGQLLGHPPEKCGLLGRCTNQHVVEANGDVYPCDFYMLEDYKLGNLERESFPEMDRRFAESAFLKESQVLPEECGSCPYFRLCRGGCRRDRQGLLLHETGSNYYCESFRRFYAHAIPKMRTLLG